MQQRIAFGERAGQKVRRIGSGFGYEGERPTLGGPCCHQGALRIIAAITYRPVIRRILRPLKLTAAPLP